jgi:hypothetical protein
MFGVDAPEAFLGALGRSHDHKTYPNAGSFIWCLAGLLRLLLRLHEPALPRGLVGDGSATAAWSATGGRLPLGLADPLLLRLQEPLLTERFVGDGSATAAWSATGGRLPLGLADPLRGPDSGLGPLRFAVLQGPDSGLGPRRFGALPRCRCSLRSSGSARAVPLRAPPGFGRPA